MSDGKRQLDRSTFVKFIIDLKKSFYFLVKIKMELKKRI